MEKRLKEDRRRGGVREQVNGRRRERETKKGEKRARGENQERKGRGRLEGLNLCILQVAALGGREWGEGWPVVQASGDAGEDLVRR